MTLWWRTGVAVVAVATLLGCSATDRGARACTEIGSPAGVAVTVTRDAVPSAARLELRLCQDTCVEQLVDLRPGAVTVGETCTADDPDATCSASSSRDGTLVGFVDALQLRAGPVEISGAWTASGRRTVLAEITVLASATHPNGADCPAGGPQAAVTVTADGLR
ncbi:hypothetical protein GCM10022204_30130 [Microlunatus aurantiacus]|uniref:Lipoprotein n=1 Tax=Microlunatus aurantiacus TaxID=446786 RepID=A0ABP7DSS0_9ACTN